MGTLAEFRRWLRLGVVTLVTACGQPAKPPVCTFVYGGQQVTHRVPATTDPYAPEPVSIAERFSFRGVYLTGPRQIASFNLYVFAELPAGPRLLTQLSYRPPYHAATRGVSGYGFTGRHRVYAPNDRELEFWCDWGMP